MAPKSRDVDPCHLCGKTKTKYTCPRCSIRTCSLDCTKRHKAESTCTGQRDRAAYIPMNAYGPGSLFDDYTYLEDVSRNVANWGRAVFEDRSAPKSSRGGRGGGSVQTGRTGTLPPKETRLQRELATLDIELLFLPEGMQRRMANQSKFNVANKAFFMGLTFTFRWPPERGRPPFDLNSTQAPSVTTHNNNLSEVDLFEAISKPFIDGRAKELPKEIKEAVKSIRNEPDSLTFLLPVPFFKLPRRPLPEVTKPKPEPEPSAFQAKLHPSLPVRPDLLASLPLSEPSTSQAPPPTKPAKTQESPAKVYWELDRRKKVIEALRNTAFIEWPEIEVWPTERYERCLREGRIEVRLRVEPLPTTPIARATPIVSASSEVSALVAVYSSDSESS